jgi:hypothetical protein
LISVGFSIIKGSVLSDQKAELAAVEQCKDRIACVCPSGKNQIFIYTNS